MLSTTITVTLQTSTSGKIFIFNQVQYKIPSTYLGISSSPDGNQIYTIEQLKEKYEIYTKIVNSNKIQKIINEDSSQ